jgi:peptidyl-tRNA hydrolase
MLVIKNFEKIKEIDRDIHTTQTDAEYIIRGKDLEIRIHRKGYIMSVYGKEGVKKIPIKVEEIDSVYKMERIIKYWSLPF